MFYRKLGRSGLKVSVLSFGSWVTFGNQVDFETAKSCMHLAYDKGVNFFDNAEVYAAGKSEEVMGKIIADAGWERSSFLVSSKVFWGGKLPNQFGLSRKHVFEACHASLRRLKLEYLDLFFCHRPDVETPVEETVRAMNDLVTQGKILYWGTSEWSSSQIIEAMNVCDRLNLIRPVMEQPQYNMLVRNRFEVEYAPVFDNFGIGSTVWSPLCSGILTGKYSGKGPPTSTRFDLPELGWLREKWLGDQQKNIQSLIPKLKSVSDSLGLTLSQLAILWVLKNPRVSTAILGASKRSQLEENLQVVDMQEIMTEARYAELNEIIKFFGQGFA
jgi:voltage-dependent potassium channel beta subunit